MGKLGNNIKYKLPNIFYLNVFSLTVEGQYLYQNLNA